jgi:hypothetical protein
MYGDKKVVLSLGGRIDPGDSAHTTGASAGDITKLFASQKYFPDRRVS